MKVMQLRWTEKGGWDAPLPGRATSQAQAVFCFGATALFKESKPLRQLLSAFPDAVKMGCSTAGEIMGAEVTDNALAATIVTFDSTMCRGASLSIHDVSDSREAGLQLAESLPHEDLVHVLVLSDGLSVNGSDLAAGLKSNLPSSVAVTGGLSADGFRFKETQVLCGDSPGSGQIAVMGLYGSRLKVGFGSVGGWDMFGPERLITHSDGNILYELDGMNALDLYERYLGDHANGLPATGLLFPLALRSSESPDCPLVRTILSVDREEKSLTFAGDVPEGVYARFMKANFDRLIDGAVAAAKSSRTPLSGKDPDLALLISCVGRRMVLKQRTEEEIEGVRDILGPKTVLTGFYSYGEICPATPTASPELHNQTMTITTFSEV